MAGNLTVQTIQGPSSGANANKIIVPSGHTLAAAGHVIQVVEGTSNTYESSSSTSYVSSQLTASITPKFSTSHIYIISSFNGQMNGTNLTGYYTIYRDTTNLADANSGGQFIRLESSGGTWFGAQCITYRDSPATTNTLQYSLRYRSQLNSMAVSIGISSAQSTLTLMEIAQ